MSSALKVGFTGLLVVTVVVILLWEPRPEQTDETPGVVQIDAGQENFPDRTSLVLGNPISLVGIEAEEREDTAESIDSAADLTLLGLGSPSESVDHTESEEESLPPEASIEVPVRRSAGEHIVSEGESLYRIARQHYGDGLLWREIVRANPGLNPGILHVGRKLVIPTIDRREESATRETKEDGVEPVEPVESVGEPVAEGQFHIVGPGESLYGLAKTYYGNGRLWRRIQDANPDLDNWSLHPGMKIRIPPEISSD